MRTILAALLLSTLGCASVKQGAYHPPDFVVAAAEADAAWARARHWIAEHGDEMGITPLLALTETELRTAPPSGDAKIYVTVTRNRQSDGAWRFEVLAENANPVYSPAAARIEVMLARYVATGE